MIQPFPLHLVPAELIFLYFFLHSSYTENDTENTKIQQQEAGGRCNMVSFFSISDQPFP